MIVGQAPPLVPRGQGAGAQQPLTDNAGTAIPFAELLMTAMPATANGELEFTSNGRDFRGTVTVGDDAIRFDARPMVAPTHLPAEPGLAPATAEYAGSVLTEATPVLEGLQIGAQDQIASRTLAASGSRHQAFQAGAAFEPSPSGPAGAKSFAGPVPVHRTHGSRVAAQATDKFRDAALDPRASVTLSQTRPPASVTVSPQEVLVLVHGIALSAAEQKLLLQDVRDLLAAHGLGERTVRLRTDSRTTT